MSHSRSGPGRSHGCGTGPTAEAFAALSSDLSDAVHRFGRRGTGPGAPRWLWGRTVKAPTSFSLCRTATVGPDASRIERCGPAFSPRGLAFSHPKKNASGERAEIELEATSPQG